AARGPAHRAAGPDTRRAPAAPTGDDLSSSGPRWRRVSWARGIPAARGETAHRRRRSIRRAGAVRFALPPRDPFHLGRLGIFTSRLLRVKSLLRNCEAQMVRAMNA